MYLDAASTGLAGDDDPGGVWQLTWATLEKPVALVMAVTVLEPGGSCPARSRSGVAAMPAG